MISEMFNDVRKLIGGKESGEVDSIKNGDRALCRYVGKGFAIGNIF